MQTFPKLSCTMDVQILPNHATRLDTECICYYRRIVLVSIEDQSKGIINSNNVKHVDIEPNTYHHPIDRLHLQHILHLLPYFSILMQRSFVTID